MVKTHRPPFAAAWLETAYELAYKMRMETSKPANSDKSIFIADAQGRHKLYSTEGLLAAGLNRWKGWRCSAGAMKIHISVTGETFVGVCRQNGSLGNIYKGELRIPREWIVCGKQVCFCGADMMLRKSKTLATVPLLDKPLDPTLEVDDKFPLEESAVAGPVHFHAHADFPKEVTWDLSRRCNYSCSYCSEYTSNKTDPHRTLEELKTSVDQVNLNFAGKDRVKFILTGGEPTIHPQFMEFMDYMNSFGHLVHVQSNGSRAPQFYADLNEMACLGLSAHIEEFNEDRFVKTCAAVVERKARSKRARELWFGVRIMVGPNQLPQALRLRQRVSEIPGFTETSHLHMSPLYDKYEVSNLQTYEPKVLETIYAHS